MSFGCTDARVLFPFAQVEDGRHQLHTLSMAVATLEAAIADHALSKEWRSRLRLPWLKSLQSVSTASALQALMLSFDRHVQWKEFEGASIAKAEEEGEGEEDVAQRASDGRRELDDGDVRENKRVKLEEAADEHEALEVEVKVGRGAPSVLSNDEGAASGKGSKESKDRRRDKRRRDSADDDAGAASARTRHTRMQDDMIQRALDVAHGGDGEAGHSAEGALQEVDMDIDEGCVSVVDDVACGGMNGANSSEDLSSVEVFLAHAIRLKRAIYGTPSARHTGATSGFGCAPHPIIAGREALIKAERVEADFWRAVSGGTISERSDYSTGGGSADVDPSVSYSAVPMGDSASTSGFPRPSEVGEVYAKDAWSPYNLPSHSSSLFSHLIRANQTSRKGDGGATASKTGGTPANASLQLPAGLHDLVVPQMRLGMLWSVESPAGVPRWGVHPWLLYGASFLLAGLPKTWYVVPPADAESFEALLKREASGVAESTLEANASSQSGDCNIGGSSRNATSGESAPSTRAATSSTLLPPALLATAQLQVCRVEQQPGEIVVTAPRSYHFALSHGTTVSESTVFATDDWLPYGLLAQRHAKQAANTATTKGPLSGGRVPTVPPLAFSLEELILRAACSSPSVRTSSLLLDTLRPLSAQHAAALEALQAAGASLVEAPPECPPADDAARATTTVSSVKRESPDLVGDMEEAAAIAAEENALLRLLAAVEPCAPTASSTAPINPSEDCKDSMRVVAGHGDGSHTSCYLCAQPCFLSYVRCSVCSDIIAGTCHAAQRVACAEHGLQLGCDCAPSALSVTVVFPPALLVRFEALLNRRLARRARWLALADETLAGTPELSAVDSLLAIAERMQLCEEPQVRAIRARRDEGTRWVSRASTLLSERCAYTLSQVDAHLAKGEAMLLRMPHIEELRAMAEAARAWEVRAEAMLATPRSIPLASSGKGLDGSPLADETGTAAAQWDPSRARSQSELRELLNDPAAASLRLPLVDEIKDEIERLGWVSSAEAMVASEPDFGELKELLSRAEALGVRHLPDAVELSRRFTTAGRWVYRANNALRRRSYLPALETLAQEGSTLGVTTDQLKEVRARIDAATSWAKRARVALGLPPSDGNADKDEEPKSKASSATTNGNALPSVESIRSLAAEAAALDVTVAEEVQVGELVKKIDWWVKRASAMFIKRGSEATLLELLQHDPDAPPLEAAGETADGGTIDSVACAFCTGNDSATTSKFMIGCDGCDRWYHGPCVGVDKRAADAMTEYQCLFCVQSAGGEYVYGPPFPVPKRTRRPRLRQVAALLDEAAKMDVVMPEVEPMRNLMIQAESWQADAAGLLDESSAGEGSAEHGGGDGSGGSKKLRYEILESVLARGEACEVEPESLAALRKVATQFLSWQARALALLRGDFSVDEPLTRQEAEIEDMLVDGIEPAAGDTVDSDTSEKLGGVRCGSGGVKLDRSALRGVSPNSLGGLHLLLLEAEELRVTSEEVTQLQAMAATARRWQGDARAALSKSEPDEKSIASLLQGLEALPLRLRERSDLQARLATQRWLLTRRPELSVAISCCAARPSLALLRELCLEAEELSLGELAEVVEARARLAAAEAWDVKVEEAIRCRDGMASLANLLDEADQLGVVPLQEASLRRRVNNASSWAARAAGALEGPTTEVELQELLAQAEESSVPQADRDPLIEKAALATWWRQRANAVFVKEGCRLTLAECLDGDGHYELATENGGWAVHLACSFCTGCSRFETAQFMIGCDSCDRWYHGPCVGVSKAEGDAMNEYACPTCAGQKYRFGPPYPVPRKTRRPRRAMVKALMAEAVAIGVEVAEQTLVGQLLRAAEEWDREAEELLGLGSSASPKEGAQGVAHWNGRPATSGRGCADLARIRDLVARAETLEVTPGWLQQAKASRDRLENWNRNFEMLEQVIRLSLARATYHATPHPTYSDVRMERAALHSAREKCCLSMYRPCGHTQTLCMFDPAPHASAQATSKSSGRAGPTAASMAPPTTFSSHGFLSAGAFPGDSTAIGASLAAEASVLTIKHVELLSSMKACQDWRVSARSALRSGADVPTLTALCNVGHMTCSPEAELLRIALVRGQAIGQLLDPSIAAAAAARAAATAAAEAANRFGSTVGGPSTGESRRAPVPAPAPAPLRAVAPGGGAPTTLPSYTPAPQPYSVVGSSLPPTAPPPVLIGANMAPLSLSLSNNSALLSSAPSSANAATGALDSSVSLMAEEEL